MVLASELLESIAASSRGVKPSFRSHHVLKALLILKEKEPLGRHALSKQLLLGVSSTRTLIKRLKTHDLIRVDPVGGCMLTSRGRLLVDSITNVVRRICDISNIIEGALKLAKHAYAALLIDYKDTILSIGVLNARDILVSYGAKAALIILVDRHGIFLPPDNELNEKAYPTLTDIARYMKASCSDIILVSYSDSAVIAEHSLYDGLIDIVLRRITI